MNSSDNNSNNSKIPAHRRYSAIVIDGADRAASRAMYHALGWSGEDFQKSQIGIASTWNMVTPCNMHIDKLAQQAEQGVGEAGGKAMIFNTIGISDGISMGTEGMKYSLVSREVIADSIETVAGCEGMDGLVAIGGCDKNMPGCLIALARLNRPAVFVYGGSILPGCLSGAGCDLDDPNQKSSTLCRYLKRSADTPVATFPMMNSPKSSVTRFPAPAVAAACIPPTRWLRPSKRWA